MNSTFLIKKTFEYDSLINIITQIMIKLHWNEIHIEL